MFVLSIVNAMGKSLLSIHMSLPHGQRAHLGDEAVEAGVSCLSVKGCASGSLFAAATMWRFSAFVGMRMEGLLNTLDMVIHLSAGGHRLPAFFSHCCIRSLASVCVEFLPSRIARSPSLSSSKKNHANHSHTGSTIVPNGVIASQW